MTANRGDVANTPPDLLSAIGQTVKQVFEEDILGSREYQDYEEASELEEQYQTSQQERKDFTRRKARASTKRICDFKGVELIEPGVEMGVIALFNQVYSLEPSIFPFRVVDYDSKRGYDALVSRSTPFDLSKESLFFIEFKYLLTGEFNHSFDNLVGIICWDCNLNDGAQLADIQERQRQLHITGPTGGGDYTHYMLVSSRAVHNIEVFVLKTYLKERLGIEFKTRTAS